MKIRDKVLVTGLFLAMLSVVLGAFTAHILKSKLTIEMLEVFQTGVKYQMYHAFYLIVLSLIVKFSEKQLKLIYGFVIFGILLFSGSLYLLAFNEIIEAINIKVGVITPFGGVFLISSWLLAIVFLTKKSKS
jgi:uncharacterized membrane protein YgdD (TMEM256/DUF423 family)